MVATKQIAVEYAQKERRELKCFTTNTKHKRFPYNAGNARLRKNISKIENK
jgi:hypothetical protein